MTALRDRIARRSCLSVSAHGDRCTRSDPHGPEDVHRRGAAVWGYRNDPGLPAWVQRTLRAREMGGEAL